MGSDREAVVAFGGVVESGSGTMVERGSGFDDTGGRGRSGFAVRAKADQRSRAWTVSAPNQSFTVCRAGSESSWVKRMARHFFALEQVT